VKRIEKVTAQVIHSAARRGDSVAKELIAWTGYYIGVGLANLIVEEAKRRGVKLLLLNIPREVMEQQAVDKGDIRFFEVAHLEVEINKIRGERSKLHSRILLFLMLTLSLTR
jgi:hypothetical protein